MTSCHNVFAGQVGQKKLSFILLSGSQLVFYISVGISLRLYVCLSVCIAVCFSSVKLSVIIFSLCHAYNFIIWWNLIWFDLLMLLAFAMASLQFVKIQTFKTGFSNLLTAHNKQTFMYLNMPVYRLAQRLINFNHYFSSILLSKYKSLTHRCNSLP